MLSNFSPRSSYWTWPHTWTKLNNVNKQDDAQKQDSLAHFPESTKTQQVAGVVVGGVCQC